MFDCISDAKGMGKIAEQETPKELTPEQIEIIIDALKAGRDIAAWRLLAQQRREHAAQHD